MKNSVQLCSSSIKKTLSDFIETHPKLKFRYSFAAEEHLHLIEVTPSDLSNESYIDELDSKLTDLVMKIDFHQSIVIFPFGDSDFSFEQSLFEVEGLLFSEENLSCKIVLFPRVYIKYDNSTVSEFGDSNNSLAA